MLDNRRFPKKTIYLILLYITSISILIRFPFEGVEIGAADSWGYHVQINQVRIENCVAWIYHPLSVHGFYPPYLEIGAILIYGSTAEITGISTTHVVLIDSMLIGLISILFTFILAREIFRNDFFAIIAASLFACSPVVSKATLWGMQMRMMVAIMSIVSLFLILRLFKEKRNRLQYTILTILSLIAFSSIHRSGIYMVGGLLTVTIALMVRYLLRKSNYYASNIIKVPSTRVSLAFMIIFSSLILFGSYLNREVKNSFFSSLFEHGYSLSIDLGFPIVLIVPGFFTFIKVRRFNGSLIFFMLLLILTFTLHFILPPPAGKFREPVSFYMFHITYFLLMSVGLTSLYSLAYSVQKKNKFLRFIIIVLTIMFITPHFLQVQNVESGEKELSISGDDEIRRSRLYHLNIIDLGLFIRHGCEVDENSMNLFYGVHINRVRSFSNGKKIYPQELLSIEYSKKGWDIEQFLSNKGEGYTISTSKKLVPNLADSYLEHRIDDDTVNHDFIIFDINLIIMNAHSQVDEMDAIEMFFTTLLKERYEIYSSESHRIFHVRVS